MNSISIVLIFVTSILFNAVAVRISVRPLAKFLNEATSNLTSIINVAQADIAKLQGFQIGTNNIDIKNEVYALPTTISLFARALGMLQYDLNELITLISTNINQTETSSVYSSGMIGPIIFNIPINKLQPYINIQKNVSNIFEEISHSIELMSNIILAFIKPELSHFSASVTGEEILKTAAVQYINAGQELCNSLNKCSKLLLSAAQQSLDVQNSSETGLSNIVMNTINGIIQQLGQQILQLGSYFTVLTSKSVISDISNFTNYFHINRSLILLNSALASLNTLLERAHGWIGTLNTLYKLAIA